MTSRGLTTDYRLYDVDHTTVGQIVTIVRKGQHSPFNVNTIRTRPPDVGHTVHITTDNSEAAIE